MTSRGVAEPLEARSSAGPAVTSSRPGREPRQLVEGRPGGGAADPVSPTLLSSPPSTFGQKLWAVLALSGLPSWMLLLRLTRGRPCLHHPSPASWPQGLLLSSWTSRKALHMEMLLAPKHNHIYVSLKSLT